MDDHHVFQVRMCERFGGPVLNVASADDGAHLGERFDATNADIRDDFQNGVSAAEIKNFVQTDARSMPQEWADKYQTVVLGEYIEHCDYQYALATLKECVRVTKPGGVVVLTFPLDKRPKEEQHEPEGLYWVTPGFSSWHRTVWIDENLDCLFREVGVTEILRCELAYPITKSTDGKGVVVRKPCRYGARLRSWYSSSH